jgi:hypothetical protein
LSPGLSLVCTSSLPILTFVVALIASIASHCHYFDSFLENRTPTLFFLKWPNLPRRPLQMGQWRNESVPKLILLRVHAKHHCSLCWCMLPMMSWVPNNMFRWRVLRHRHSSSLDFPHLWIFRYPSNPLQWIATRTSTENLVNAQLGAEQWHPRYWYIMSTTRRAHQWVTGLSSRPCSSELLRENQTLADLCLRIPSC